MPAAMNRTDTRVKKILFGCFLVLLFGIVAVGPVAAACNLDALIEAAFKNRNIYCPNQCGITTARLLDALSQEEFDLSEVDIIFVLDETRRSGSLFLVREYLSPVKGRSEEFLKPGEVWGHHIFATWQGFALDLHSRKGMSPLKTHLRTLFPEDPFDEHPDKMDRLDGIRIRPVPAPIVLAQIRRWEAESREWLLDFMTDASPFPTLTLNEYMNRLNRRNQIASPASAKSPAKAKETLRRISFP